MKNIYFEKTNLKSYSDQHYKNDRQDNCKIFNSVKNLEDGQVYKVYRKNNEGKFEPLKSHNSNLLAENAFIHQKNKIEIEDLLV